MLLTSLTSVETDNIAESNMSESTFQIWKPASAPANYRAQFAQMAAAEWIAFIPAAIYGKDLDEEIRKRPGVDKHHAPNGGVVYAGEYQLEHLLAAIANAMSQSQYLGEC